MRFLWFSCFASLLLASASGEIPKAPISATSKIICEFNPKLEGSHQTGRPGSQGWEVDYSQDKPGYVFQEIKDPLLLSEGLYRFNYSLRRGHYPKKGLFHKTLGLFRLEVWDLTAQEKLISHEIQIGDLSKPNQYETRWLEFSLSNKDEHQIEPRVYWVGLGNGEVKSIQLETFPPADLHEIDEKALRLGDRQEGVSIENGYVVSRKMSGEADETGDATTYTGFYVASLAWKWAVTKDDLTLQALENGLEALHNSIKGDSTYPLLTRYVDKDDTPFPKSPSKDVYTSFYLAYSVAYPIIQNKALKQQMKNDIERLTSRLITDGLIVNSASRPVLYLTPYFSESEVKEGIHIFLSNKKMVRQALRALEKAKTYLPFTELWPGINETKKAIRNRNEKDLYAQVIPTMNGVAQMLQRIHDILREQYREDLFPRRIRNLDYPGKRLLHLIEKSIQQLPNKNPRKMFDHLYEMRVLASNAILVLHMAKTAAVMTNAPQFEEFYKNNLYGQESLLKTALDWYAIEEDFFSTTLGNTMADRHRRGYLTTLALYNLIQLEKNPAIKSDYQSLLRREWQSYRREDNPLMLAINTACHTSFPHTGFLLRALDEYPEDRTGFGKDFWQKEGADIARVWGGGETEGYSKEALPIWIRPKDSFLWQRNARRLKGDDIKEYPSTDYLFLYWFARYHELIPELPRRPVAVLKNNGEGMKQ